MIARIGKIRGGRSRTLDLRGETWPLGVKSDGKSEISNKPSVRAQILLKLCKIMIMLFDGKQDLNNFQYDLSR